MSSAIRTVAAVLPVMLLMGCANFVPSHRHHEMSSYDILALADLPAAATEAISEEKFTGRKQLSPEVVPDSSDTQADQPLSPRRRYWRLPLAECACRAAAKTPIADLIELEKQIVASRNSRQRPDQSQILQQTLLSLRATDLRNQAAGQALELYYKLVEVEAGRDAVRKSIQLVDAAMTDLTRLQGRGLSIDVDEFELRQQRLELVERQHELVLQSNEINRQLKLLMDTTTVEPPIWPDVKLRVVFKTTNADLAVATGVESRADLTMLRLLAATVDTAALSTARSALRQREGSLGNVAPTLRDLLLILQSKRGEREIRIRQRQLAGLLSAHYKTIVSEIRGGVAKVEARQGQIRLSKRKLDLRRRRLSELKQQQRAGGATVFDIFRERLEIIRAETELMKHVVAWKTAQVKLKQAQGLLAEECGYGGSMSAAQPISAADCFPCLADNRPATPTRISRRRRLQSARPSEAAQPQYITSSLLR